MSKLTNRDKIWSAALQLREEKTKFRTNQVLDIADLSQSKHRTARRVLHSMKAEGWLEHKDSTDKWWKPPDTAQVHPSAGRLKYTDVSEVYSNVIKGERLEVEFNRISNGDNIIAYPEGCQFSGKEDGIHIEASREAFEAISDLVPIDGLIITAKVEMQNQKVAKLIEITEIRMESLTTQSGIFNSIDKLKSLSKYGLNNSEEKPDEAVGKPSSDSSEDLEPSEAISTGGEKPELPLEPSESHLTQIYYVATNKAECYHRIRSCEGLRQKEGELLGVIKEVDGKLPEEVSDLRKCHRCG